MGDWVKAGLRPDDEGEVFVYKKFWSSVEQSQVTPALLIYADLMGSGNSRNIEAAQRIYIMNYNISSDEFDNLLIKELLEKLSRYFEKEKLSFYVIGATARDIIMQKLLQQRSARHTQDLDIAIAIADWQKFEEISNGIAQMDGFESL